MFPLNKEFPYSDEGILRTCACQCMKAASVTQVEPHTSIQFYGGLNLFPPAAPRDVEKVEILL